MEDALSDLQKSVTDLQVKLASLTAAHKTERRAQLIGLAAIVSLIAAFWGVTGWHSIPKAANDAVVEKLGPRVQAELDEVKAAAALLSSSEPLGVLLTELAEAGFGERVPREVNGKYIAESDGFVVAMIKYAKDSDQTGGIQGLIDGEAHSYASFNRSGYGHGSFTMPVRKGENWQVHFDGDKVTEVDVHWTPFK